MRRSAVVSVCVWLIVLAAIEGGIGRGEAAPIHSGFGTGNSFYPYGSRGVTTPRFGNCSGALCESHQARVFTVPSATDFRLTAIEIALTLFSGANALDVWVVGNDVSGGPFGIPDESQRLEHFRLHNVLVRDVPGPAGPESIVFINSVAHPLLKAGTPYWLVLSAPEPDTYIQWWGAPLEFMPRPDLIAERFAHGPWEVNVSETGPGSAFRIHADPVPEPSTWILLGTGLMGLLGYGWRRQWRV